MNKPERSTEHTTSKVSSAMEHTPIIPQSLCGYQSCTPSRLQKFATPKWLLATLGFFVFVQSMLVSGITSSVITTIEKRYGLRSAESGLVVSSFDIGSLLVVIFVSYFGGQGHRVRWVGIGSITVGVGALLFAFPQFISSPYQPAGDGSTASSICMKNQTNATDPFCEAQEASSLYLFLFVISNMIMGIGSTPIYTLGTTFIYDNVPRESSPVYISILYAVAAVGPAMGYVLGGSFLTFYVDLGKWVSPDDPQFLGAWWLGYVISSGLCFFVSVFLLMFPRKLKIGTSKIEASGSSTPVTSASITTVTESEDNQKEDFDSSVISFGKNLKELPKAFLSLLSNPIYLCITCAGTLELSIITGFLTFLPKYLQSHFGIAISTSSMITGAILVPSAGTGILLGGYIVKRFSLNTTGCARTAVISNVLSLALFIPTFLISCPTVEIAGINNPISDPRTGNPMVNLLSECNNRCSCAGSAFTPVCVGDVTFYNPCYAGCESSFVGNASETVYGNCSCSLPSASAENNLGTGGECPRDCTSSFIPYLVCLFLLTMATVCAHTPSLMVTYRCVGDDERPFAAGVQFVFFRTLAYIPAPIYFGLAIDRACLWWNGSSSYCDSGSGSCLLYSSDVFRLIFFGVAVGLKVAAFCFVLLAWLLCRHMRSQHTHTTQWRRQRRRKELEKQKKGNTKVTNPPALQPFSKSESSADKTENVGSVFSTSLAAISSSESVATAPNTC